MTLLRALLLFVVGLGLTLLMPWGVRSVLLAATAWFMILPAIQG